MAAPIPIKGNPEADEAAFQKVREDKRREVLDGHDGTWVAHPDLVKVAIEQFDEHMPTANQIDRKRNDIHVEAEDLVEIPRGAITEEGLRSNISVGIQYIASWLSGNGAAPINHLMEDAAIAEISRSQVWHWIRLPEGVLIDGRKIDISFSMKLLKKKLTRLKNQSAKAFIYPAITQRPASCLQVLHCKVILPNF